MQNTANQTTRQQHVTMSIPLFTRGSYVVVEPREFVNRLDSEGGAGFIEEINKNDESGEKTYDIRYTVSRKMSFGVEEWRLEPNTLQTTSRERNGNISSSNLSVAITNRHGDVVVPQISNNDEQRQLENTTITKLLTGYSMKDDRTRNFIHPIIKILLENKDKESGWLQKINHKESNRSIPFNNKKQLSLLERQLCFSLYLSINTVELLGNVVQPKALLSRA